MYCPKCGNELIDGSNFCRFCGETLTQGNDTNEEQDFLDTTHRLLRWERKAWSIGGKFLIIFGIIFAAIYALFGFIGVFASVEDESAIALAFVGFLYAILIGGMLIGLGIVNRIACDKIPRYLDSMYNDFKPTEDRCGSIGMIVFTYFFNNIALVFFVINFVRMKTNKALIQRILNRQARTLPPTHEAR